jgi:Flp pilus assembly protein protease CpaA
MSFGTTLATALLLFFAVILILWAIKDAMSRRKSPFLVVVAVVFFFPFGLIAWLLFRPAVSEPLSRSRIAQPQ